MVVTDFSVLSRSWGPVSTTVGGLQKIPTR